MAIISLNDPNSLSVYGISLRAFLFSLAATSGYHHKLYLMERQG